MPCTQFVPLVWCKLLPRVPGYVRKRCADAVETVARTAMSVEKPRMVGNNSSTLRIALREAVYQDQNVRRRLCGEYRCVAVCLYECTFETAKKKDSEAVRLSLKKTTESATHMRQRDGGVLGG